MWQGKSTGCIGFYSHGVRTSCSKRSALPGMVISFSDEDYPSESVEPHEGALVITAQVGPIDMKRIMIDNSFSVDILYTHAYQRLDLEGRKMKIGQESPLYRFNNDLLSVVGTIELPVTFGTAPQQVNIDIKFFIVHVNSAYNAILGQTTLAALHAVTSIPNFKLKFVIPNDAFYFLTL